MVAKRALVKLILSFAACYEVLLSVNRDSGDKDILSAYRRVVVRVHPDKGGRKKDFQSLQAAKESWDTARQSTNASGGRPPQSACALLPTSDKGGGLQIQSSAVLLTYSGRFAIAKWKSFLSFVRAHVGPWGVKFWCATLEKSTAGHRHIHLQLQFHRKVNRSSRGFAFDGCAPNASPNDYLGGAAKRASYQQSVDRAFLRLG